VISEEIVRGRFRSIARVGVEGREGREGREGKEGKKGSFLTSCLTVTSFFTFFFRVIDVGVSAAAAGLGGSALGS
jgi:hypothetical protein